MAEKEPWLLPPVKRMQFLTLATLKTLRCPLKGRLGSLVFVKKEVSVKLPYLHAYTGIPYLNTKSSDFTCTELVLLNSIRLSLMRRVCPVNG